MTVFVDFNDKNNFDWLVSYAMISYERIKIV